MPELPEVETVVRELRALLPGREVVAATLTARDLYRPGSRDVASLAGVRVDGVERRGKAIVVSCRRPPGLGAASDVLVVHLGMTGRLEWSDAGATAKNAPSGTSGWRRTGAPASEAAAWDGDRPRETPIRDGSGTGPAGRSHLHARWWFRDGSELRYHDPRRFGFIFVGAPADVDTVLRIGPDPFEIGAGDLALALAGRRAPVKALLLDQRIVSGLGNIYVDEALYLARVHPLTPGDRASAHARVILAAARRVLTRAIRARGTTLRDYRRTDGARGGFQVRLSVYGREGKACARCGGRIVRLEVAQRGTHVCPRCQRRPRVSATSGAARSADRSRPAAPRPAGYTRSR